MKLSVSVQRDAFDRLIKAGVDPSRALANGAKRTLLYLSSRVVMRLRNDPLQQRSGALAKSWKPTSANSDVRATAVRVDGHLASESAYAAIHEHGGTVTPKSAKYLSIPLPAEKTAAGVARHRSPREVADLFPIRSKAGKLLLVKRVGKRLEPHFLLLESVRIPARRYLSRSVAEAEEKARDIFEAALLEHLPSEPKP